MRIIEMTTTEVWNEVLRNFYAKGKQQNGAQTPTTKKSCRLVFFFYSGGCPFLRPFANGTFKVFQLKIKYDKEFRTGYQTNCPAQIDFGSYFFFACFANPIDKICAFIFFLVVVVVGVLCTQPPLCRFI